MKESQSDDPKKMGEHPDEMHRLGEHPEAQRLTEHPEPGSLPAHDEAERAAAPVVDKIPATSDAQETRGIFRGAGWVALALLAIMVAAALIWRPRVHNDGQLTALSGPGVPGYTITQIDGVVGLDSIVELVGTVNPAPPRGVPPMGPRPEQPAMNPSAVVVYLFNTDKSEVPETASLTEVAKQVAKSGKTVVIKAYTDETGNPAYNRRLSERRARAVGDYMVAHGVPAKHIKAKGYGPTHAYADNAQDRRAEVTVE